MLFKEILVSVEINLMDNDLSKGDKIPIFYPTASGVCIWVTRKIDDQNGKQQQQADENFSVFLVNLSFFIKLPQKTNLAWKDDECLMD